jgi:hypothetical protein
VWTNCVHKSPVTDPYSEPDESSLPYTLKYVPLGFADEKSACLSYLSQECYMSDLSHSHWFDRPYNIRRWAQIMNLPNTEISPASFYFLPLTCPNSFISIRNFVLIHVLTKYPRKCISLRSAISLLFNCLVNNRRFSWVSLLLNNPLESTVTVQWRSATFPDLFRVKISYCHLNIVVTTPTPCLGRSLFKSRFHRSVWICSVDPLKLQNDKA